MKLKLIVASMSILGLVAWPVFASAAAQSDSQMQTDMQSQDQTDGKDSTPSHKKHHRHHRHHKMKHMEKMERVEKEERVVVEKPVCKRPAMPLVPISCTINQSSVMLQQITQNVGRSLPNPCCPGWYNRISLTGGINVDLGKWGNRNANYMGENYQRLSLNDAYLNISAMVNEWVNAFASISYNTASINDPAEAFLGGHVAEFDAAYDGNHTSGSTHTLQLEQAYATFGNFAVSPVYLQVGKQFQDFGRYQIHPITESLTQVMSKTLATSAKLGFIANGFDGSVYVFDSPIPKVGQSRRPTVYGAALGYSSPLTCKSFGWDIGLGYISNLIGVNDIAYNVNQFNVIAGNGIGYHTRVAGAAAYLDLVTGPFTISARYVQSLQKFNINDLPRYGTAPSAVGAKPWTAGVQLGYGFTEFFCVPQYLYVGYQQSKQAVGLLLPERRWLAGYNVDVWTNTNFGLEYDHDYGYSTSNGGTGKNTNLVSLRAAVKFS